MEQMKPRVDKGVAAVDNLEFQYRNLTTLIRRVLRSFVDVPVILRPTDTLVQLPRTHLSRSYDL